MTIGARQPEPPRSPANPRVMPLRGSLRPHLRPQRAMCWTGSRAAVAAARDGREAPIGRPIAPEPDPPDPAPERQRIERELGIDALATGLEPYGTPPIAPLAGHTDRDALERELLDAAPADVSRWNVSARRSLRNQVRE